ncbi:MAG TPA: hypothetical protein DIU15_15010 [Deltaproteobacteria bacterium]|nr:hypothetical protein [Deltaproteobacteria bacterium]HCP47350.1 hypothetical protein [Deltaproteobacteria bacterium]|tara:strand:+ start:87 stop:350 length:264 start_codon:yes stop_codon:yes gene_type:complete
MKIRILADGATLSGTPTEVVQQMHARAFAAQQLPLAEYIEWAVQMARDMLGVTLQIQGDSDEARATSLVTAMLDAGLAEELDDQLCH